MISIIIPTRNEEKIIGPILKKIRDELTAHEYELIVSDGGSTDRTVEIAKQYARVLEYRGAERHTIAWGKNEGARQARGDMFIFIGADVEIPDPNRFFTTALLCFARDPQLVGLTVNLRVHPKEATLADRIFFGLVNIDHHLNNNVTRTGSASGEFQMIPRAAFEKVRGYKEYLAVAEDNDMFRRLAQTGHKRFESVLTVYHTGRRGHEIGWPRLLREWFINYISLQFFDRSDHQ